jgi:hypothetical protein
MDLIDKLIKRASRQEQTPRPQTACPDEETLASFVEGRLEKGLEKEIREHLLSCDSCLELAVSLAPQFEEAQIASRVQVPLKSLRRVLRLDPAWEGAWELVIRFARGLVQALRTSGDISIASPVPAEAFRGGKQVISENLVAFRREFPPYLAEIEVEKIRDDQGEITVSVNEKETGKPAQGLRVSLFDPDRELESYVLDQGQAVFENVRFGKYLIHLTQKGKQIGKISLNMKT